MPPERIVFQLNRMHSSRVRLVAVDVTDPAFDNRAPYLLRRQGVFGAEITIQELTRGDLELIRDWIDLELKRAPA